MLYLVLHSSASYVKDVVVQKFLVGKMWCLSIFLLVCRTSTILLYQFQGEHLNHVLLITGQAGVGKSVCSIPCNLYLPSNEKMHFLNWLLDLFGASGFLKWPLMLYHLLGNCACYCISSWSCSMWVEYTHTHNLAWACSQFQFRYLSTPTSFPPPSVSINTDFECNFWRDDGTKDSDVSCL